MGVVLDFCVYLCTKYIALFKSLFPETSFALLIIEAFMTQLNETIAENINFLVSYKMSIYVKDLVAGSIVTGTYLKGAKMIFDEDVVIITGFSNEVLGTLRESKLMGRKFRVIIFDNDHLKMGELISRFLLSHGIPCCCVPIGALGSIIKEATKAYISAESVLDDGTFLSFSGSASIVTSAHSQNIPVMVTCQGHKLIDIKTINPTETKAITTSEILSDISVSSAFYTRNKNLVPYKSLVNLSYELVSPNLLTVFVTEFGVFPSCFLASFVSRFKKKITQ